jgi:hypothetical protein
MGDSFMDSYRKRLHKKDIKEDFEELEEEEC